MKSIRFSGHAREQLGYRGVKEEEIVDAIQTTPWQTTELGRLECRKNFRFGQMWNGKYYATKQVRPIFVDGSEEIVVVTVYSYYF